MARLRVYRVLATIDWTRPNALLVEDPIYDQLLPCMEQLVEAHVIFSWYYVYSTESHAITVSFSSESLVRVPARKSPSLTLRLGTGKITYSCTSQ